MTRLMMRIQYYLLRLQVRYTKARLLKSQSS